MSGEYSKGVKDDSGNKTGVTAQMLAAGARKGKGTRRSSVLDKEMIGFSLDKLI